MGCARRLSCGQTLAEVELDAVIIATPSSLHGTMVTAALFENNKKARISVNWSDESSRKMSTKVTIWGRNGRICADRQGLQVYLRDLAPVPHGYHADWNVRDTTELTQPVNFYLRGEEYSAQLDYFIRAIEGGKISDEY